jgi:hypothetical protein
MRCSSSAWRLSKMKGACDSHCCWAASSRNVAWSTFCALALPPFLVSLSDRSWASSSSLAIDWRFALIVLMFCISLLFWKLRKACSTSLSTFVA